MRLFIGLTLPKEARLALADLQSGLPGARWVNPENLHLTLRFIGEVDRGSAEDIALVLSDIVAPGFSLNLSGLGCFESKGRVRALWVGVLKSNNLKRLHEKVESAVVRAGLEPERRKFKPHVTLARFRNGSSNERIGMFIQNHNDINVAPFVVNRFTLLRSYLGHTGSVYEPLADYELYEDLMAEV